MSIEKTGPLKYKFQDDVCIELMLRFFEHSNAKFLIEPPNGEDGRLQFSDSMANTCFEIQVKGSADNADLKAITHCLAHFDTRKSDQTLLSRLMENPKLVVILVMTGRCNDTTVKLTKTDNWQGEIHPAAHLTLKDTENIRQAFAKAVTINDKSSKLTKARAAHCIAYAKSLKKVELQATLRRLIVIDNVTEQKVTEQCRTHLVKRHRIALDKVDSVVALLEAQIHEARSDDQDVFQRLRNIIEQQAPAAVKPPNYVLRGDENCWIDVLTKDGVLLLSGSPRVGKSDTARWIAAHFEQFGYRIEVFRETADAERFLLDSNTWPKLALLDDPLGGIQAKLEFRAEYTRLMDLVARLSSHRKLIVAQPKEILLMATNKTALTDISIHGIRWRDLGQLSADFLAQLWLQMTKHRGLSSEQIATIKRALREGELSLEPGCIKHLINHWDKLSSTDNIEQIIRLAREDAHSLGTALAGQGFENLLTLLAINTSPQEAIESIELAFIEAPGDIELPGKLADGPAWTGIILGGDNDQTFERPQYDPSYTLPDDVDEQIEHIERRGMLAVSEQDDKLTTNFTHPFYRASAQNVLANATRRQKTKILTAIERGLFCLSPITSRATARNLHWLFEILEPDPNRSKLLVELAISGLHSYFPTTRDLCFKFLIVNRARFIDEQANQLPKWIDPIKSVELSSLQWINGFAWIPMNQSLGADSLHRMFGCSKNEVSNELIIIDSNNSVNLTPEQASLLLLYYKNQTDKITLQAFARLLSFDEGIIRGKAVKYWISMQRTGDTEELTRVFNDDHPAVAFGLLQGAQKGWHDFSEQRQNTVLQGLKNMASQVHHALAMIDELIVFERHENPPWVIFETIFPMVIEVLPANALFNSARFFNVIYDASEHLSAVTMVKLCDVWTEWLKRLLAAAANEGYDEWVLSIADILIYVTKEQPQLRSGRIQTLLSFNYTSALVVFIKDLVSQWEYLTADEREQLISLVSGNRTDVIWLQGAAITRDRLPAELVDAIVPNQDLVNKTGAELLNILSPPQLEAAIKCYTGIPGLFWFLSTQAKGETRWQPVLELIARDPVHPLFGIAWQQIAYGGNSERVTRIIRTVEPANIYAVFEQLLKIKLNCNGNFMPQAWTALFERATDNDCGIAMFKKIVEFSPAILERANEVLEWFEKPYQSAFFAVIKSDVQVIILGRKIDDNINSLNKELIIDVCDAFEKLFDQTPPKLLGSCRFVTDLLNKHKIEAPKLLRQIKTQEDIIKKQKQHILDSQKLFNESPTNWIGKM